MVIIATRSSFPSFANIQASYDCVWGGGGLCIYMYVTCMSVLCSCMCIVYASIIL